MKHILAPMYQSYANFYSKTLFSKGVIEKKSEHVGLRKKQCPIRHVEKKGRQFTL